MTLDKKAFSVLPAASRSSNEHVLIALIIKDRKHDISLSEGLHEVLREVVLVRNIDGDGSPLLQRMTLPARGVAKVSGAGTLRLQFLMHVRRGSVLQRNTAVPVGTELSLIDKLGGPAKAFRLAT